MTTALKNFTVIDCEQRTDAWRQARCGVATASRASDIIAQIKSGEAAARRDYRIELAVERITGRPAENGFMSADMQRGIDLERVARIAYESYTGDVVEEVGFLKHTLHQAGCSPDGWLDGGETLLSIKCPKSSTMIRYFTEDRFPLEYEPQMLCELYVSGASRYEFFAFDDRLPVKLQAFHKTIERSSVELAIHAFEQKLLVFLADVAEQVQQLERLCA